MRRPFSQAEIAQIEALLEAGQMNASEIASAVGRSAAVIFRKARSLGWGFVRANDLDSGRRTYRLKTKRSAKKPEPAPLPETKIVSAETPLDPLIARFGARAVVALMAVPRGAGEYAALRAVSERHGLTRAQAQAALHRVRAP